MGNWPMAEATFKAIATRRYRFRTGPGDAPVTVASGSRDRLPPRDLARHLDQLPPDTWVHTLSRRATHTAA